MISGWTIRQWYPSGDEAPSEAAKMLTLLAKQKDIALINAFLTSITAGGDYTGSDNDAMITAIRLLLIDQAAALIEHIIAGNLEKSVCGSGNLLLCAVEALPEGRFEGAAEIMVEALPGQRKSKRPTGINGQIQTLSPI